MTKKPYAKAYLEITNRCNLSCSFCHGTKREGAIMSPSRFRAAAAAMRPFTDYLYLHVLGEPLSHPRLGELLDIADALGFRVCITTNGTLLTQTHDTLLSHAAVLHKISISLHAGEANPAFRDEAYLPDCLSFAKEAAAAGVIVALRLWNLDSDARTKAQNAQNESILSLLQASFPAPWEETRGGAKLAERLYLEYGETFDWPDMAAPERGACGFCYALRDQFAVLADGTVVPCCLDAEGDLALGNLFDRPLADILASPRARALKEGFDRRTAVEPLCRRCGYAKRFDK